MLKGKMELSHSAKKNNNKGQWTESEKLKHWARVMQLKVDVSTIFAKIIREGTERVYLKKLM